MKHGVTGPVAKDLNFLQKRSRWGHARTNQFMKRIVAQVKIRAITSLIRKLAKKIRNCAFQLTQYRKTTPKLVNKVMLTSFFDYRSALGVLARRSDGEKIIWFDRRMKTRLKSRDDWQDILGFCTNIMLLCIRPSLCTNFWSKTIK